jgi:hypothetical protein
MRMCHKAVQQRRAAVEQLVSLGVAPPTVWRVLSSHFISLLLELRPYIGAGGHLSSLSTIYADITPMAAKCRNDVVRFMRLRELPFALLIDASRLPTGIDVTGVLAKTIEGTMMFDCSFLSGPSSSLVEHCRALLRQHGLQSTFAATIVDPGSTMVAAADQLGTTKYVCIAHILDTIVEDYCSPLTSAKKLITALNGYLFGGGDTRLRRQRATADGLPLTQVC